MSKNETPKDNSGINSILILGLILAITFHLVSNFRSDSEAKQQIRDLQTEIRGYRDGVRDVR